MSYTFAISVCPECGAKPESILENVMAAAQLMMDDSGNFDYAGESNVHWDTQQVQQNGNKQCQLQCANFHEWYTDWNGEG